MSDRYRLTFNLSALDRATAVDVVAEVRRMIDERCIIEPRTALDYLGADTFASTVYFVAASDAEAADLARRTKALPGLPPMDAVRWAHLEKPAR